MTHDPIITSLIDTDLYKFTMMQCVFHQFRSTEVEYQFQCRKPIDLSGILSDVQEQITDLCDLRFTQSELNYLNSLPFIHEDFIDYLSDYKPNPHHISLSINQNLEIILRGPWLETILFEVPFLAIVSESYYRHYYPQYDLKIAREKLKNKIQLIKTECEPTAFKFSDFGTRRRFSKAWQKELIQSFQQEIPQHFIGTSNVLFAKEFGIKPIGTMAHEYLQAAQVLAPDLKSSQTFALEKWYQEYQGDLGIALTDVLGIDQFLKEFNQDLSQKYTGVRHDSGDPFQWADKMIAHYQHYGINPLEKILVFSDSLTVAKAIEIERCLKNKAQSLYGIGTHLTNDVGLEPLDIVIKMTRTNGTVVIKYPDAKGKTICVDDRRLDYLKKALHLKEL